MTWYYWWKFNVHSRAGRNLLSLTVNVKIKSWIIKL